MVEESTFTNFGQVGIIVKDMEKVIAGLAKAGIGPFGPLQAAPTVRWEERQADRGQDQDEVRQGRPARDRADRAD